MPTILPPLTDPSPTAPDVDSLAARQARTLARAQAAVASTGPIMLAAAQEAYLDAWGVPTKTQSADGSIKTDPGVRANQDNLSPVEAITGYGTSAQTAFGLYAVILTVIAAIYPNAPQAFVHPVTREDLTRPPEGWSVDFSADGSGTASYATPTSSES